jgi:hypothetical protein
VNGLSVRIHDPRTDTEPAGWREFRRRHGLHPVWDYALLRVECWVVRHPPLLAVVTDGGSVLAGICVLLCRPWRELRYAPPPGAWRPPGPMWAEVCQPWTSGHPGIVVAPGVELAQLRAVLRAFERQLLHHTGPAVLGLLYRAVGADLLPALDGRARLVRQVDSVAVLRNDFADEEAWLATLSKGRRSGLRKQGRRLESGPPLLIRGGPGRADLAGSELARLLNRHRASFGTPALDTRTQLSGAYLEHLVRDPDVHTLTYHDDEGRLLALNTILDHPRLPIKQHWAALPVAEGGRKDLFFDSYRRAVRFMVRTGRPELSAGRAPHEVKRSLGFRTRPVYGVAVPRPVIGR